LSNTPQPTLFDQDEPVRETIDPPTLTVPPGTITLVLIPLADPADRPRSPEYRLKMLVKEALRRYGFDVKVIHIPTDEELAHAFDWLLPLPNKPR
jgi:hypothetical protein